MNTRRLFALCAGLAACTSTSAPEPSPRRGQVVLPLTEQRLADANDGRARRAMEVPDQETGAGESEWLPRLRRVCEDIENPKDWTKRQTEGWEPWKDKVALQVVDARLHSPAFKTWNIAAVDDPAKNTAVRHSGPFYGLALTVELENKSTEVLTGDDIYVWATLETKAGKHVCFADGKAQRSWDPFAKKGVGAFVNEKAWAEWPLRPQEKKRYTVTQASCFTEVELEGKAAALKVEVYARFKPVGGETVIAGPLAVVEQAGDSVRGAPLAAGGGDDLVKGKTPVAVKTWALWGDHVLVSDAKKAWWTPAPTLNSVTPGKAPETAAVPAEAPEYANVFGTTALAIKGWTLAGWRSQNGGIALGRKLVSAQVAIAIDSSSVQTTLDATLSEAKSAATAAATTVTVKQAEVDAAKAAATAVAGTESEAAAKETQKAAEVALADATKAQKAADAAVATATKALTSGVAGYLKAQAAQIDCGSFVLDVGRTQLKPRKGSFGATECKALLSGTAAAGTIWFDLERWDVPVALIWKGSAGLQLHTVLSHAIGDVPAE